MVWRSPDHDVEIDGATLPALVRDAARRTPDGVALVDGPSGQEVSFATLLDRMEHVAGGLAARGFSAGDVLALWAPNMPPWAGIALGAMAAGGMVTPVSPAATERELASQLADSGAGVLVTIAPFADVARSAARGTPVRDVVVVGEAPGTTPLARLLAAGGRPPAAPAPEAAGSLALLPYSSGTTGLPKGVMLTHGNLVASLRQIGARMDLSERDAVLAVAPFAHVMGFIVTLVAPLAAGATVVTMPRFDLEAALALVERHRITVLVVPPPVMHALAHHPAVDRHDLSSVEVVASGGAPLSADLQRAVAARLPHAVVGQGYGMTETAVGISGPDRRLGTAPGSVGRLLPGTELRVVDPRTGRDRGAGRPGELWVRGPQVMAGYLGRPQATAEMLEPGGWLRTGDLGHVDADGNVFILDRLKELIKVNALQVAPAELEALLMTHPQVADAAVIPRPDERTGEVPVAVVVPRGRLDPEALRAWVAERVASHKRIAAVRLVEAIPRTPVGKVLRRVLVEQDRDATASSADAAQPAPVAG